ncbi:MAG: hypothetical protein M1118_12300 [Chloroflexi bacterium]|nr:hypothetical protein [Chloroflexota bacterium]
MGAALAAFLPARSLARIVAVHEKPGALARAWSLRPRAAAVPDEVTSQHTLTVGEVLPPDRRKGAVAGCTGG